MTLCDGCGAPVGLGDDVWTESGGALCPSCRASREACPTCGDTHPACTMCGKPTRCPPDEPGEPFATCEECDANEVDTDNFGPAGECPTCGSTHPPCTRCGRPTRCPSDEPGEPFMTCDKCDASEAVADFASGHGPHPSASKYHLALRRIDEGQP